MEDHLRNIYVKLISS